MQNSMTVANAIACAVAARMNCVRNANNEWQKKWGERLTQLEGCLPSGSGVDRGTTIPREQFASPEVKLTFVMDFHHMNDGGMYDGWTDHILYVQPTFGNDFHIRVTGRDRNGIKEYLADLLADALRKEAPPYPWAMGEEVTDKIMMQRNALPRLNAHGDSV